MRLTESEKRFIDKNPTMSSRQIALALWGSKKKKSTVNDYRKRPQPFTFSYPKILIIDIETTPLLSYTWGLWRQNVGLNQIYKDWCILSYAAKWFGDSTIIYSDNRDKDDIEDDSDLLEQMWALLDEADIVIAHNGKGFDFKKMNARFISAGMSPPSSYRKVDTLEIAKRHFNFTSNRLEYLTNLLCEDYQKSVHKEYPGFELWKACMKGEVKAFEEMEKYNIMDVLSLEELFIKLAPWTDKIPNLDVYYHYETKMTCLCGGEFAHDGYVYTNVSAFDRWRCKGCGSEKRGRTNILNKVKRDSLATNVAQ